MKHTLLSSVISVAFAGLTLAQTASVDLRQVELPIRQQGSSGVDVYGAIRSRSNSTSGYATIEWLYVPPATPSIPPVSYTATLPMHRVGDLVQVSASDYLVVGRRFTTAPAFVGNIARVHLDYATHAVSVIASNDIGDLDPLVMRYDATGGRVFIYDAKARQLVATPWGGGSSLPTSFSTAASYTSVPALARPNSVRLETTDGVPGVRIYPADGITYAHCTSAGGQWQINANAWQSSLGRPVVTSSSRYVTVNRPWNLQVYGAASFPLAGLVQSEEHANVAISLTSATPSITPLQSTATPGSFGSLSITNGQSFDFRTCVRYGLPQNTGFYPLGEAWFDIEGPYAERQNLLLAADVLPHATNGTTNSPAIAGEVRIGFRGANGVDPVTINGDAAVLTPAITMPFLVQSGALPRDLSFTIPSVPPEMAGSVALIQIFVTDGSQSATTDVFGLKIKSSTPYQ